MKTRKIIYRLVLFAIYCLLVPDVFAGAGKTACQFLKISPSARASGMGGVSAGLADDVFALYSNPAGLVGLEKGEVAATYLRYFADVNYGFIGYAAPLKENSVMGVGYTYLVVPDIEKRDVNEANLGTFNASDTALNVSYAKRNVASSVLEGLSIGGSIKAISSQIDTTIAYAFAADLGAMYSPAENLNTALVIQNISPGIKFVEVTDPLPLNVKLGVAYSGVKNTNLGIEIDEYVLDNKFYAAFGGEYWPVKQMALRAGYKFGYHTESLGQIAGLGVGMGFRIWSIGIDYAFAPYGELGDTHRITFIARF
ncbi:MAG: PorV/PorQ family protein [Endomicrobiales bacterium]|nr:PorV/PorQ family protein [Endomicrobiales bacterium]